MGTFLWHTRQWRQRGELKTDSTVIKLLGSEDANKVVWNDSEPGGWWKYGRDAEGQEFLVITFSGSGKGMEKEHWFCRITHPKDMMSPDVWELVHDRGNHANKKFDTVLLIKSAVKDSVTEDGQ